MKAYAWGYKNCASAEKHTLTPEQTELLVKLRVNVVFAYDTDVSYKDKDVAKSINKLRRVTNVYTINDYEELLGGAAAKNSPVASLFDGIGIGLGFTIGLTGHIQDVLPLDNANMNIT